MAEFGRHVDRLSDMGFHGRIELVGSGGVRPRGLRMKTKGPLSADVGVSMPDIELGENGGEDWT